MSGDPEREHCSSVSEQVRSGESSVSRHEIVGHFNCIDLDFDCWRMSGDLEREHWRVSQHVRSGESRRSRHIRSGGVLLGKRGVHKAPSSVHDISLSDILESTFLYLKCTGQ